MATAFGTVSRVARNIRLRQRARSLQDRTFLLILLYVLLMAGAYLAYGPRVVLGSRILGQDVGGLKPREAAALLEQAWRKYPPLKVQVRDSTLSLSATETGFIPDFEASAHTASSWLWWVKAPVHDLKSSFDDSAISRLAQRIDAGLPKPKDANLVIENDVPRIAPSFDGLVFDVAEWKQSLTACFRAAGTSLSAPLRAQRPQTTTEAIEAMRIRRLLSVYTTKYVEDGSRSNNIRLAASRMSGALVAPGEKISFNERVGPRTEELGYREAHVFIGDRIEDDFGGGVCQVSTTLYNALFMAGVEILERSSHSMTVDYVPLGRDAAVAYGVVDLVFRNTTPGHILIVAETKPGHITFKVYGDGPDHRVIVESKILFTTDFKIEVVQDPTLPLGQREVTPGKVGYRVVAYKIVWEGQREVSRSILNYSNYKPMKQVIKEGTKPL